MKQTATPQSKPIGAAAAATIAPLRLRDAREAHAVFVNALLHDFDYFDSAYKQVVLAENNLVSMMRAVLLPSRLLLVAKDQGRIVGYVIGSVPKNGNGQIYWLFVDRAYRGQNLGLALLSRILKIMAAKGASQAALITHDHATYYARQGFKMIEQVPDGRHTRYVLTYTFER